MRLTTGAQAALPTWYWYGPGAPERDESVVDPVVVETLKEIRKQWE